METAIQGATRRTIPVREIRERLGVSERRVYALLDLREIPALRLGTRWIISRARYEQWEATFGKVA